MRSYSFFIGCCNVGIGGFPFCANALRMVGTVGSSIKTKSLLHLFQSFSSSKSSALNGKCGDMDDPIQEEAFRSLLVMASQS